jgi:hypothetical protein
MGVGVGAILLLSAVAVRTQTSSSSDGQVHVSPVTALVTMSTFSAVASSVLTDDVLEQQLTSGGAASVLLFAGREGEQAVVDRTFDKVTTMLRRNYSVEVNIPSGNALTADAADLPAGWSYAVQLEPSVNACCDGGDGHCSSRSGEPAHGSLNRSIAQLRPTGEETRHLVLSLTQLPPPQVKGGTDGELHPSALIRLASTASVPADGAADVSRGAALPSEDPATIVCTLQVADAVVATGRLRAPVAAGAQQSIGSLDLTYRK